MKLPEMTIAQIDTVFPDEGRIAIVFPTQAMLSGIKVKLAAEGASARTGLFRPLKRGDWGLVCFYQNDPRSCVWVKALPDNLWNSYPAEIMADDPAATVEYEPSGTQRIRFGNGDEEVLRPDNTLIRITHSDPADKAKRTPRMVSEPDSQRQPQRKSYTPPELQPCVIHVDHASGTTLTLDEKGNVDILTAGGHSLKLDDTGQKVSATTAGGQTMTLDDASGEVMTKANGTALTEAGKIVEKGKVHLGSEGAAKAVVLDQDSVLGTIIDSKGGACTFELKVKSSAAKAFAE